MRFIAILALLLTTITPSLALAQVPVSVEPLESVLVDLERRAPADVRPLNDSLIAAEVAAVVQGVHAEVGQQVAKGDLLLQLDATDYELGLRQAEANLVSAKAQKAQADAKLERATELLENQYLSADALLDRETDVAVWAARILEAEVAIAVSQRNLEKCRVTAPFNGVVAERHAQVGAFVTNGNPLLRLTQVDQFELDAEIPVSVADSLETAETVEFLSRGQRWPVSLLRLAPTIEKERRSRRARFTFTGNAPAVGRSGEVVWQVEDGQLPSNLVARRNGQLGVFLHVDGKAVFKILPGAQEGRPVMVGLPGGSEVIIRGRDRVQDGDAVTVTR
jgi:RND family efflux transporter MFP subunit